MSRRSTNGEVAALRTMTQLLEGVQCQFAEQDQHGKPPKTALRPAPVADISFDDWDVLISAVKARLRLTVGTSPTLQFNGAAAPWQASVLECVDALDQLHLALRRKLAGRADRTA
jgi:hypothetical protein